MTFHLYAFGSNGEGQLGIGIVQDKVFKPTTVIEVPADIRRDLKSIHGGGNHTILLTHSNTVWAAGSNQRQQLGFPPLQRSVGRRQELCGQSHIFVEFFELYQNLALCSAGWESSAYAPWSPVSGISPSLFTAGSDSQGELGRGIHALSYSDWKPEERKSQFDPLGLLPTELPSGSVDIAAGSYHYVTVLKSGEVYGWGRSRNGQLGVNLSKEKVSTPTLLEEIPFAAKRAVCGQYFTYIVGEPASGEQVVLGTDKHRLLTDMPDDIKGWKDIGATWNSIFVLLKTGELIAWGKQNLWQLIPPNLPLIDQIAVGSDHILALTREGKLLAWGWGSHGNLGDISGIPHKVNGYVSGTWNEVTDIEGRIVKIGAGHSTSFALTEVV